jgi:hypothetical protein
MPNDGAMDKSWNIDDSIHTLLSGATEAFADISNLSSVISESQDADRLEETCEVSSTSVEAPQGLTARKAPSFVHHTEDTVPYSREAADDEQLPVVSIF